jgi:hypothetical protein
MIAGYRYHAARGMDVTDARIDVEGSVVMAGSAG